MNENLDRIRSGWKPRPDAHWFWWIISDIIMLRWELKAACKARWARIKRR